MDDATPSAWVLEATDVRPLRRALHATRPYDPERTVLLGPLAVCVDLGDEAPAPPARVERRLGRPVEVRLDCAVAHYPLGRGFVVLVVARSDAADPIDVVLDAHGVVYREVARPNDLGEPARVCLPRGAIADLSALTDDLAANAVQVSAVYEVGGCAR